MSDGEHQHEWEIALPFWIDTEAYSDRDRLLFVAGYEFALIVRALEAGDGVQRPIHRENESRARMLAGRFKRSCTITPHVGYEGCETWSDLVIQ